MLVAVSAAIMGVQQGWVVHVVSALVLGVVDVPVVVSAAAVDVQQDWVVRVQGKVVATLVVGVVAVLVVGWS